MAAAQLKMDLSWHQTKRWKPLQESPHGKMNEQLGAMQREIMGENEGKVPLDFANC